MNVENPLTTDSVKKRLIMALDIDGTLTNDPSVLQPDLIYCLKSLADKGWLQIFLTGRSFSFAHQALVPLSYAHYIGVQNGASLIAMPQKKVERRAYLSIDEMPGIIRLLTRFHLQPVVESGFESRDVAYYVAKDCAAEDLAYLQYRETISKTVFQSLASWQDLPCRLFAAVKVFGPKSRVEEALKHIELEQKVEASLSLSAIRDPFRTGGAVGLICSAQASKGCALQYLLKKIPHEKVVCAGDDVNDISMLLLGDERIVMAHAPDAVKECATQIAPSDTTQGIIDALNALR